MKERNQILAACIALLLFVALFLWWRDQVDQAMIEEYNAYLDSIEAAEYVEGLR